MSLEAATYISDLNASNPAATDLKSQGDDHLRLLKSTIKATFPNVVGPVTATAAQLNSTSVSGSISMWPTATAPSGFLMCDGSAVSRTTYAALFAVVGVLFGAGDGSTTFALPNYQNKMPIGAGGTYAAAATGGSKDAIVVSHTHGISASGSSGTESAAHTHIDSGHTHTVNLPGYSGAITPNLDVNGGTFGSIYSTSSGAANLGTETATHTHAISVSATAASTGVTGTDANLPPYLGIYFIIKT